MKSFLSVKLSQTEPARTQVASDNMGHASGTAGGVARRKTNPDPFSHFNTLGVKFAEDAIGIAKETWVQLGTEVGPG